MRWTIVVLIASTVGCVPSLDVGLPPSDAIQTYVFYTPGRPALVFDANEQISIALGDEPIYALAFEQSREALQLPDEILATGGARRLDAIALKQWVGEPVSGVIEWSETREPHDLAVPALDGARCLERPGACIRGHTDGFAWCQSPCEKPQLDPPGRAEAPRITVERYLPETCPAGQAPFGVGACADIAPCPDPGDRPADIPAGPTYDVQATERITDAIVNNPSADVFYLASGDYPEAVDVSRAVTLWSRCPTETSVRSVTLAAGGTVGRLTVTSSVVSGAAVTITKAVIGGAISTNDLTVTQALSTGPVVATGGDLVLSDAVLTGGTSSVSRGMLDAQRVRVIDGAFVIDGNSGRLTDVAFHEFSKTALTVLSANVVAERLVFEQSAPTRVGIVLWDANFEVSDARFTNLHQAIGAEHGSVRITDVVVQADEGFVFGGALVAVDRVSIDVSGYGIVNGNSSRERPLLATNIDIRAAQPIWVRESGVATYDRVHLQGAEIAIETRDAEQAILSNVIAENVARFLQVIGFGTVRLQTVSIEGAGQVVEAASSRRARETTLEIEGLDARTVASGLRVQSGVAFNLSTFRISGGAGPALELFDRKDAGIHDGIIENFEVGVSLSLPERIPDLLDRVIVDADQPVQVTP